MGYNMAKNTMCNTTNPKEEGQLKNGEEQLKNIMGNQEEGTCGTDTCDNEKENEKEGDKNNNPTRGHNWTIPWVKPPKDLET